MVIESEQVKALTVKQLFSKENELIGSEVCIQGWVRTCRKQKSFAFVHLSDGTSQTPVQVIIESSHPEYELITEKLATGAAISVVGRVKESPASGQSVEIEMLKMDIVGPCPSDYPLQKKNHSFEFLRTLPSLRPRTNTQGAVARLRSRLAFAVHQFFQKRDFVYLQAPIITTSDCEGAGELFTLSQKNKPSDDHFFGKEAYLTVSGQLNAESYALAFSNTYTFGPTFRAENSHTSRHVAEFWMIEPEMAFCDLQQNMQIAQEFIHELIDHALTHSKEEMAFFDKHIAPGKIESLQRLSEASFKQISYTEVISLLEKAPVSFEYPVSWGIDLQSEHERYIAEQVVKGPVIIYNYPKTLKPFYMREQEDGKTVAAMDVIVPGVGEIIGGSQREERYDVVKQKMLDHQLDLNTYGWYLDLRKYGTAVHSGFGMGFERMVQYLTGLDNIRDVCAFPRVPGHAVD